MADNDDVTSEGEPRAMTLADIQRARETLRANAVRPPPLSLEEFVRTIAPQAADSLAGRVIIGVDWSRDRDRTGVVVRTVANPGGGEFSSQLQASRDGENWVRLPADATVEMLEASSPDRTAVTIASPSADEGSRSGSVRLASTMRAYDRNEFTTALQASTDGVNWTALPEGAEVTAAMQLRVQVTRAGEAPVVTFATNKQSADEAAELLALKRKQWREEAFKRTCWNCISRWMSDDRTPKEPIGIWFCADCGGTGYTLAAPITADQLHARLAWWERDRLAECDHEPAKAWFAGNAALMQRLAGHCWGVHLAREFYRGLRASSDVDGVPVGQLPHYATAKEERAAVAEIPSGPWDAV